MGSRWSAFHNPDYAVLKGPVVYAAQPVPAHVDAERVRVATRLHRLPGPVLSLVAMVALVGGVWAAFTPLMAAVFSPSVSDGDAYTLLIPVVLISVMALVSVLMAGRRVVDALAANPYKKRSFAISTPSATEGSVQGGKVSLASLLTRQRLLRATESVVVARSRAPVLWRRNSPTRCWPWANRHGCRPVRWCRSWRRRKGCWAAANGWGSTVWRRPSCTVLWRCT